MTKKNPYPILLLIVCIILLVVSIAFFKKYTAIQRTGGFHKHNMPPPVLDINMIEGWMTFGYLNHSFGLPNDYLKEELNITSKTYPNITIIKAAKVEGTSVSDFTNRVKVSIQKYVLLQPNPYRSYK